MVGAEYEKIFKSHWLKRPKTVLKKKETWTKIQMVQNLMFGVYLLISEFLVESPKANENQQKRSLILQYSLAQKTSLISRTSTHLILQKIYSCKTVKNLPQLANFLANMLLLCVRKNISTAPFLNAQELHSQGTWKANVCIFQ